MTEVIEKTENKKGYKKTKLGWIPEDWDVIKLGSIIEESTLKSSVENQLPVLTSSRRGLMYQTDYYNEQNVIFNKSNIGFNILPKGYITYRSRSDDGFFTFNLNKLADGIVSIYYPVFKTKLNDYFVCSLLNISSKILYKYAIGSSQKVLSISDLSKISYGIPNLKEQEKIAEILSAWDEGIETLEKLIEHKEIFHKALMKNLLIGKIRLSEFSSKWTHSKFNSVFERITRKNEELNSNILTISAQNGLISQKDFYNKRIASVDTSKYILLKNGEFAYNKSYSNGYPLGAIKRLDLYEKGVVSSLYICFKLNNSDSCSDFWKYYFEAGMLNREIKMIAQEGARNHGLLNMATEDFFNMLLFYPKDIKEQQKIADILNKSEKEIQILNSKLEKLKEQKKGLMQKLLTGQIRVKI